MKNGLWTKWIFVVGHVFFCLMSGCTSIHFYPEPTNHQPLAFMGSEEAWEFLKVDTGQHFLDKAPWMLPDVDDIFSKSIHDVQSEFEMLDWQVNQLIISLSDMIQEIDSHQKERLQINRTNLESSHDATREQRELWVGSKGGSTFGATSGSCNDVRELFQNFGNPNRYRPTESDKSSSAEYSKTTTTVSTVTANIYSTSSISASSIFQRDDIHPTPSLFADTRTSDYVSLQSTFSADASDSENLDPFEQQSSPTAGSAVTHFDFSSGNHFSMAETPLATSTPFKDASSHFSNELFSSLGVAATPAVPSLIAFVSESAHTIRSSYSDMTADQKSTNNLARTATSEPFGPPSSWHVMDSYFDLSFHSASTSPRSASVMPTNVGEMTATSEPLGPRSSWLAVDSYFDLSFHSASTSARSASVTPTNVGEMTRSSVAIVSLYEASTQAVTFPGSSPPTTVSTHNVSVSEWEPQLHSSQVAPQAQSQNAAHSLDALSHSISSISSLMSSFIGTTVGTGNLLTSRALESSLKDPWASIVGTSTFSPLLGSLTSTSSASADLKVTTSLTPSWIETYSESRVVPSTQEEVVRTSFDTKLQSASLVSATAQAVLQMSVVTPFGSSVYSTEQTSVPGSTQTPNVFSNTLLSSSTFRFPTVTDTDTNLMSGSPVSVIAVAAEQSATTQPMQQVSVFTPFGSSVYSTEQTSVPGFTQTASVVSNTLLSSGSFHFPLTDTSFLSSNLGSASVEVVAQSSMKPFGSSKYSIERNSVEDFTRVTNAFSDSLHSSTTFHVPLSGIITNTPTPSAIWSSPLSAQTVRELPTINSFLSSTTGYAATSKSLYDSSQTIQLSLAVYSTTKLGSATIFSSSMLAPSPASTYSGNLTSWTTQANMDSEGRSQAVSSGIYPVVSSTGRGVISSTLAPAPGSTGKTEVLPGSETSFPSVTSHSSTMATQADSLTSSFGSTAGTVVSPTSRNPSSTLSPTTVQPGGLTLVMTANLLSTSPTAASSAHLSAAAPSEAGQRTTAAAQSTVLSTPVVPSAFFIDASTSLSDSTAIFASSASVFSDTPSSTNSLTNKGGKTAFVSLSQLLILFTVNVFLL